MSIGLYLLEDEEWLRKGLKKLIPWQKLDLVLMGETGSGSTAVMELLDKKPDLFLCDIRVPGETGLSVIRKVRPYLPEMKCILISGYQDFSYAREAIDLNVLTYLLKPVKEEELTKALSNAVDLIAKEQKHRYSQRLARNTILVNALEHPLSPEQTCDNSPVLPGPASYCVAVFYVSGGCTYQIFSDLTEHIRQILAFSGLHCDLYQKSSSEYGIIFSSVHSLFLTEQAAGFIRELDLALSRMGEHYSCLGSTVHKLSDIPVSYNTAKMAYLYRDVHAASHVAFYQEDMIKSLRLPPPSLLEEFHLALGSGDTVQINNLLESMFEQLRSTQGITIQECMDSLSYPVSYTHL